MSLAVVSRAALLTAASWVALAGVAVAQDAPRATELDEVIVTGAPYRGIGIPGCIRQGRQAARAAIAG